VGKLRWKFLKEILTKKQIEIHISDFVYLVGKIIGQLLVITVIVVMLFNS